MTRIWMVVGGLVLVAAVGACDQGKGSASCSDIVFTPGGPAPRACVHEVPNGATVTPSDGGTTIVTLNGQVVATYPPCPCTDTTGSDAATVSTTAATCPGPISADAGVTSLSDLPIAALCAQSPGRLIQWKSTCAGSIVVVLGEGVDCSSYWLFDATTQALQATGHGCNVGPSCTGGVAGFRFPTECFDGNFSTDVVSLCP